MKLKTLLKPVLSMVLLSIVLFSCSKDSGDPSSNDLVAISGNWQNTTWGGANDTARINITDASADGKMIYLSDGAESATNFSVGDVVYSNIKSEGNNIYSATGSYRYGTGNTNLSATSVMLTLQNNNTVLFAHYSKDVSTSITPPDYYWTKQ